MKNIVSILMVVMIAAGASAGTASIGSLMAAPPNEDPLPLKVVDVRYNGGTLEVTLKNPSNVDVSVGAVHVTIIRRVDYVTGITTKSADFDVRTQNSSFVFNMVLVNGTFVKDVQHKHDNFQSGKEGVW